MSEKKPEKYINNAVCGSHCCITEEYVDWLEETRAKLAKTDSIMEKIITWFNKNFYSHIDCQEASDFTKIFDPSVKYGDPHEIVLVENILAGDEYEKLSNKYKQLMKITLRLATRYENCSTKELNEIMIELKSFIDVGDVKSEPKPVYRDGRLISTGDPDKDDFLGRTEPDEQENEYPNDAEKLLKHFYDDICREGPISEKWSIVEKFIARIESYIIRGNAQSEASE